MDTLRLRFAGNDVDLPLTGGVHGIGRIADGSGALGPVAASPAVAFCVDRRGVWLTVPPETRGVHVNGRPVRRMAMLRVGDAIFVDGTEMRLVAAQPPRQPDAGFEDSGTEPGDARVVLRGVGGQYHGRSFTLERPRLVGRAAEADIRIDEPAFAERHARLEIHRGEVVLRDLGSAEGSVVNGEAVRDAVLQAGDQVVFDAHHRFVVEAPAAARTARAVEPEDSGLPAAADPSRRGSGGMRLPWLLVAALVLAGLLALLLLFGAG
ncbi:FHA domain-containing protein [Luteimonas sp. MC1782]|uniref:FHA domain-containing protein n=1 Tax=Luteimonas sp. MC1782 TaxID=2760305 RepID=UPI0016044AEB|nr:FHA domain-containing protein [Luteimonas sp. MC1782]MBB1472067.1 FHA domain-containing protein [Luteimonas sp. MC1782]